jgi:hypothetical protein
MPAYTTTLRYSNAGASTDLALTITADSPELGYVKDGDTYRFVADNGNIYVFPETALIYIKFVEQE